MRRLLSALLCLALVISLSVTASASTMQSIVKVTPIAVDGGENHTVVLYSNGTVRAIGDNSYGQCDVEGWTDIIQIATSFNHTVGLKRDGTVVAVGDNSSGQCNVSKWKDITKIDVGEVHTVGLRADGTVCAVGGNNYGQCNVSGWRGMKDIAAARFNTCGVKGGDVYVIGAFTQQEDYVMHGFNRISKVVVCGTGYFLGIRQDGTVVGFGRNTYPDGTPAAGFEEIFVDGWKNVIGGAVGRCNAFGLTRIGTVLVSGRNDFGQIEAVEKWTSVKYIGAGLNHVVAILADGTLVAAGDRSCGKCDVYLLNNPEFDYHSPASLGEVPVSYKYGKLWTRSEQAVMGAHTKADAPTIWRNFDTPGHTQGPVFDSRGNQYSFALHMDGNPEEGMPAEPYMISFALNGQYTTFSGVCAYPAEIINVERAPYTNGKYFQVYGDGVLLYTSPPSVPKAYPEPFSIPVTGVQELTIYWPDTEEPNEAATLFDPVLSR